MVQFQKNIFKKRFLGITEFLQKRTGTKNKTTMVIYNKKLSVSPLTTHVPIKYVAKNINIKKIIDNSKQINDFYKFKLKKT